MTPIRALFRNPFARLLFRVVVGAVFIAASLDKVQHPVGFARSVSYYHMLPPATLNVFALLVPWVELVAGVALVIGVASRGAGLLVGGLLAVFTVAIVAALARGIDISCGCFSTIPGEGHKVGIDLVVRDVLMLVAVIPVVLWGGGAFSLDGVFGAGRRGSAAAERSTP